MAPLRLHANLLFYGLDEGTWSDPPSLSIGSGWTSRPWDSEATWQNSDVTICGINGGYIEPSTDEGSEPKGSESDSLPESNEGYLGPSHSSLGGSTQTLLPYTVSPHAAVQAEAGAVYPPYVPPGSFMAAHGYGGGSGGGEAGPFAYEAVPLPVQPSATAENGAVVTGSAPDGVPSIGSYAHLSGQCSRCCFHPKGRCANGYSCQFCHFDHDKRPRNGKKKRYRRQSDAGTEEGNCDD